MSRTRSIAITALAIALALAHQQAALSQGTASKPVAAVRCDATCVVYPLAGIGHDPNLAQWLAETIPCVVEPDSWRADGVTITCHAASRVLVVRQTPVVHAKIKSFLAELKNAAHQEKGAIHLHKPPVLQAEYTQAIPTKAPSHAGAGYPVPAPQTQPKHLFHLILRYEGDGLPETAVESVVKQISDAAITKSEGDGKKGDAAKGPSLGQLLHFIVRYEGDGIIDANVVQLLKELNKDGAQRFVAPVAPACGAYGASSFGTAAPMNAAPAPSGFTPASPYASPPQPTPTTGYGSSIAPFPTSGGSSSSSSPAPVTLPGTNPAQGGGSQPAATPQSVR